MIATLRGRTLEVHANFLILEVAGIGYQLKAANSVLAQAKAGEERLFYIHDHIREDSHDLFAFASYPDLEFFEKLLGISGVGPKVALTLMSTGTVSEVKAAVMRGDLDFLTSVPGVGKKTAQKIVLELKGQLVETEDVPTGDREVLEALVSLGYGAQEARQALKVVAAETIGIPERIREALKYLSK